MRSVQTRARYLRQRTCARHWTDCRCGCRHVGRSRTASIRRFIGPGTKGGDEHMDQSSTANGDDIWANPLVESSTYLPIMALPYWAELGPFITRTVSTVSESGRDLPGLYSAITPFVLWCWQSRGIDLRDDRIFRRTLADQFIHLATPTLSPASKATHRGALWRAIAILNPQDTSVSGTTLPRSAPTIPYNDSEIAAVSYTHLTLPTKRIV